MCLWNMLWLVDFPVSRKEINEQHASGTYLRILPSNSTDLIIHLGFLFVMQYVTNLGKEWRTITKKSTISSYSSKKEGREIHGAKRTQTSEVTTEITTLGTLQRTLFIYFRKMKG